MVMVAIFLWVGRKAAVLKDGGAVRGIVLYGALRRSACAGAVGWFLRLLWLQTSILSIKRVLPNLAAASTTKASPGWGACRSL
jgi:hypothetical protein